MTWQILLVIISLATGLRAGDQVVVPVLLPQGLDEVVFCSSFTAPTKWDRMYPYSVAAMYSGSMLDAASTWHQREANPLLRSPDGTFGTRGLVVKLAITTVQVLLERWVMRKHPRTRKAFVIGNFAFGGGYAALAMRNWRGDGRR